MIILEPFIWREDHYAYHLTHNENIDKIKEKGLIPKCGIRSKSVGDSRKAIYFIDCYIDLVIG